MAEPLLLMEGVTCIRGGRLLFERLDLILGAGEAGVVTGPNGAGKSSLLRVAAGLLRPSAGRVALSARLALSDERHALDERLTVAKALGFWATLDRSNSSRGMERMGLEPLAGVPVRMLSTGQRKRASLARLVGSGAELWLLDEPTNGLDAEGQERLTAAMAAHRSAGGAILAATHQPLGLHDAKQVVLG